MNTEATITKEKPPENGSILNWLKKYLPPDIVREPTGNLTEVTCYYLDGKLKPGEIFANLTTAIKHRTFQVNFKNVLPKFRYRKPPTNQEQPFAIPDPEDFQGSDRENYVFVGIVRGALRPPNHLYRSEDAIVCLTKVGNKWETRFFPKSCIETVDPTEPNIWDVAEQMQAENNNPSP